MIEIKITRRVRETLTDRDIRAAVNKSARRAAVTGRKVVTPEVRRETGFLAGTVRKAIPTPKAKQGVATLVASGRPRNIIEYGGSVLQRGISAKPYGRRRRFRGAFLLGRLAYHQEEGREQNPNRPGPLNKHTASIGQLFGPGIAQTFKEETDERSWRQTVGRRFVETLDQEIRFRISRAGR